MITQDFARVRVLGAFSRGARGGTPRCSDTCARGLQLRFVHLVIRWRGRPHPVPRASGLVLDRKCAEQTPSGLLRRKLGGARYNFRNQFRNRLVVRHAPSVHDVSAQQGRYPHRIVCRMVDEQLDVVAIDEVSIAIGKRNACSLPQPCGFSANAATSLREVTGLRARPPRPATDASRVNHPLPEGAIPWTSNAYALFGALPFPRLCPPRGPAGYPSLCTTSA